MSRWGEPTLEIAQELRVIKNNISVNFIDRNFDADFWHGETIFVVKGCAPPSFYALITLEDGQDNG